MPWPCLGRAAAQLVLTCCPKSAYPIPQEAELCLYNSLLQIVIPCLLHPVIPAQAGTQLNPWRSWVPACAGMTKMGGGGMSRALAALCLNSKPVIPAKAGTQLWSTQLDPRLRGDDDKGRRG